MIFKYFRRHQKIVFVCLVLIVVVLPFFGIGTNAFHSSPQDVVMKINGEKVTQAQYSRIYNQMVRQKSDATGEERQQMQKQALDELVRMTVFNQEAEKYGLVVSDEEIQRMLASTPAFQKEGKFDMDAYYRTLYNVVGTTPKEFEKQRRRDLAANKLTQLIASTVHISDKEVQAALPGRLAIETDSKKRKELQANPEILREELRTRETNLVFNDWLNQLNSTLKINVVSDRFAKNPVEGS